MKSLLFTFILFTSFFCCAQNRKQERMMKKAVQEKAEALQQQELKLQLLKDSADKGFPSSMYNLGMLFFEGNKVPKSYDSAVKYINRAENLGYLASMMKFGEWNQYGVPDWVGSNVQRANFAMAQAWYKKAADLGYQPAIEKMNGYREAGDNPLEKGDQAYKNYDYNQAFKYWQLASEYYNDRVAMYKIAHLYLDNKLTPQSYGKTWLYKSADLSYGVAEFEIAMQFEKVGNIKDALWYFTRATSDGYLLAEAKRKEYQDEMGRRNRQSEADFLKNKGNYNTITNKSNSSSSTNNASTKTCPVCNGSGKKTDRYTSEKRDKNNSIILTDHIETYTCKWCNGKGYVSY